MTHVLTIPFASFKQSYMNYLFYITDSKCSYITVLYAPRDATCKIKTILTLPVKKNKQNSLIRDTPFVYVFWQHLHL